MIDFVLYVLLLFLQFLPIVLAYIMGFKSLLLLPLIAVAWIALVRAFMHEEKKKARRVRADGRSCKSIIAEDIIHQNDTECQDKSSRLRKREVFIYE